MIFNLPIGDNHDSIGIMIVSFGFSSSLLKHYDTAIGLAAIATINIFNSAIGLVDYNSSKAELEAGEGITEAEVGDYL